MWLGASETAFGALIGVVFDRLFGVVPSGTTRAEKTQTPNKLVGADSEVSTSK